MAVQERPEILPAVMGTLRQDKAEGLLTLEQNDGTRRFYWQGGNLIYLQSDVVGEQFGNYLLRQGILDYQALSELLANDEQFRLGEKVVQWGLMKVEERDLYLQSLQEQVMIHALEHAVLNMTWKPGDIAQELSGDLYFRINHRHFIWNTYQEVRDMDLLCDPLYENADWRWVAPPNLLESLSDLPLTPEMAYACSFLGTEPISYATFISLSGKEEHEVARMLLTLWALGGLNLVAGEKPHPHEVEKAEEVPAPVLELNRPEPTPPPQPVLDFTPPRIELDDAHTTGECVPPAFSVEIPSMPAPDVDSSTASMDANTAQRAKRCFQKAKYLLLQDRAAEAIRLLEEAVKFSPETDAAFEPWLLLGRCRMANPAWSNRAIEALQVASKLRPKAAEPWAHMADIYHRKGFHSNAKACFKKALELDPSVPVPPGIDLKAEDVEREHSGFLGRVKRWFGNKQN